MKLRIRLIGAFLLLSVVPLGAVTIFSYLNNRKALQAAATREADREASELSERMQVVTSQLSERVEHLMDLSAPAPAEPVVKTARVAPAEPEPPQVDPSTQLKAQAADTLREVAMLLNAVEVHGLRGRGRGGLRPDQTGQGAGGREFRGNSGPPPSPGPAPVPPQPTTPPSLMA